MADDAFDNANYYTCRSPELLTHTDVEDAVMEYFEYDSEPGEKILDTIKAACPLEVRAYSRQVIPDAEISANLERAVESLVENLDEEYGDPDGDEGADKKAQDALVEQLTPLVQQWIKDHYSVWACTQVASKSYSAEEVEAILREHFPEWFKE